jgi:hypothetical protein
MVVRWVGCGWVLIISTVLWSTPASGALEISPSFVGMYRKTMEIERAMATHAARYKVDMRLARAVVIQESGGNADLVSSAGAQGYFQVMPSTFRDLRVPGNIEAGIKYLAQLQRQFGREDYAIAAYNAGLGNVSRDRPLRLESLQYVISVGHYKSILRQYEVEVRRQAQRLILRRTRKRESWGTLARTTGLPQYVLFLYNPFLAHRPLRPGAVVVYPASVPSGLITVEGSSVYYISRIADAYFHLARAFDIDLDTFRRENDLWRLQQLPTGVRLRLSVPRTSPLHPLYRPPQTAKRPEATPPPTSSPAVRSSPPVLSRSRSHGRQPRQTQGDSRSSALPKRPR